MSIASCSSLKAVAGSVESCSDSIINRRVCKPRRHASNDMLLKYLADYQRNEAVVCGFAGLSVEKAPGEDTQAMEEKLSTIVWRFSGSNGGQEEGVKGAALKFRVRREQNGCGTEPGEPFQLLD